MIRHAAAGFARTSNGDGVRRIAAMIAIGLSLVACGPAAQPSATAPQSPAASPAATPAPPTATAALPAPTAGPGLGAFPPLPTAELPADIAAPLQAILDEAVDGLDVPGIAAAVISAGHGAWAGAAGTADGEMPLDPAAQFGIGSVTKTVIAAQVLQLVESGVVELDRPIAEYLGGEGIPANGATVRQVLGMRSGIGESTADPHACDDNLAASVSTTDMRAWLSDDPLFEPGTRFRYTNDNYVIAGLLIEEVTGTSVALALRSGVLSTPGLERLVYQDEERPTAPLAAPFVVVSRTEVPAPNELLRLGGGYLPARCLASGAGPAGGMASDPMTLARWGYLLYGGWVLGDEALAQMTAFQNGYGLAAHDHGSTFGVPALGHEGTVPGYVASLVGFPGEGLAVAVLVNTNRAEERDLVRVAGLLRAALAQSADGDT